MKRLKMALLRWLLAPGGVEQAMFRTHVGPIMVAVRMLPPDKGGPRYHDANRAIHCGDYTVFFYAPTEEFRSGE